ncbi:DUF5709 domain-containing protein [Nocardioides sambongensis]|uniref:DUF5709 domain-containing protein n=1 Tax=Nocardioides sambongensis TaxID=2589074 RepID=UPI0011268C0D|nr:DUF5709 domain-containing protein [Nocardioides sambongensis]
MTEQPSDDREVYGDYSVDDENQLDPADTLEDADLDDELDRGYSPPERYSAAQRQGEEEGLDGRLAQEEPEVDAALADDPERYDERVADYEPEVGDQRSGRLVDPDQGFGEDQEKSMVGDDVGIDGAAASAEEAAMHIIED